MATQWEASFFLKFTSNKFETQRKLIAEKYGEKFLDNVAFYIKNNMFFLPDASRWRYITENTKQDDIALKIDTAKLALPLDEVESMNTF